MTEKELREFVAKKAESLVGLNERDGSFRLIIDTYNQISPLPRGYAMSYTDPWCAAFVSAVGRMCGLERVILPECGCVNMIEKYRDMGRYEDASLYLPHVGDIVMYDFDGGGADHTGIVTLVNGDELKVVEGNSSDAVSVRHMNSGTYYICGYCCPDYASASDAEYKRPDRSEKEEEPQESTEIERRSTVITLPWIYYGDTGETVRAAQAMLIAKGYRCGPWGADGEYGDATYGAIYRYQRAKGLEIDGVIGDETWISLLGA